MPQPRTTLPFASSLTYVYLTIIISLLYGRTIPSNANGFTLELIRSDDHENNLLTDTEKVTKLFQLAEISDQALNHQISSTTLSNMSSLKAISLPLHRHYTHLYLVKLHLGTPGVPLFLALDTGCDLTWTQCEPCTHKFHQNPPIFDSRSSTTLRKLPCDNPFVTANPRMFRCINNRGVYRYGYGTDTNITSRPTTEGVAVQDKLENEFLVKFGCSRNTQNFDQFDKTGVFGGIFGLGMSQRSILHQLIHITHGRFSYCLPSHNAPTSTIGHLRFGDAVPMHERKRDFQATRILDVPGFYYVNLMDLSVGSHRLWFPDGTFALSDRTRGGCLIDSGAGMSTIIQPAYEQVANALEYNFTRSGFRPFPSTNICFRYKKFRSRSGQLRRFPSLTYHFKGGGNMVVKPRDVYMDVDHGRAICVALFPSRSKTIIGAISQANKRVVFDTASRLILFTPEDCLNDKL